MNQNNRYGAIDIGSNGMRLLIANVIENNEIMPLKNDSILIEMSFLQVAINFNEAIQKIKNILFYTVILILEIL